jgi:DNA mismatch endonuclease (patch repair protein)
MGATTSKRRDPAITSRMMAAVRNKDSRAEMLLRRALHARGLRYRLHARDIVGNPDLVVRSRRVAVFVDGDFWHGNAHRLRGLDSIEDLFPTNREWWTKKLRRTMERDREVTTRLEAEGWNVIRLWESDVLRNPAEAADRVQLALRST